MAGSDGSERRRSAGRTKLVALLAVMVLLPVGALGVLGLRMARDQGELLSRQAQDLVKEQLRGTTQRVAEVLASRRRALYRAADSLPSDPSAIRSHLRAQRPPVGQALVVDRKGRLLFPPPGGPVTAEERAFLDRTRKLWEAKALTAVAGGSEGDDGPAHGWHGWYEGGGLHLLLWHRSAERVVALELTRPQLLAAVIGGLPDTGVGSEGARNLTALVDANGEVVYQWGAYRPGKHEAPRTEVALAPPVAAWRLRYWLPEGVLPQGVESRLGFAIGLGLAALALVLLGGAVYLYRARTREMRVAAQRVSFVSQVSHELKTPLTSIRLYAELLAEDLELAGDDPDGDRARQLGVIVSESQRLSRLIGNVLRFSRGQEGRLRLRRAPAVLDDVVRDTVEALTPTLQSHGVEVALELGAPGRVELDADAVAQILANLLSNVEKYAASGGTVTLTTSREGTTSRLRVADRGPGIPASQAERIFEAFYRGSDKLTDGVAGTGIGLSIARRLARLHGGELRLVAQDCGACFELTLSAEPVGSADSH